MRKHEMRGAAALRLVGGGGLAVVVLLLMLGGADPRQGPESAQPGQAKPAGWPAAGRRPAKPPTATAVPPVHSMDISKLDCGGCHTCEPATPENRCLRECPRSVAEVIAEAAHETLPEDVILLHAFEWEDRSFMPVPFNHRLHADMAGMAGGCEVCHHHTAPGKLHPACKTCHKAAYARNARQEMRMPSLKGAYHRQCMGCHRDWSHNTKCSLCHLPKGDRQEGDLPAVKDLLHPADPAGHRPIENPEHIHHKTDYEDGPHVMFRHREHVELYGYKCERCHLGESCAGCHEHAEKPKERLSVVKEETHGACFDCHAEDACERCHSEEPHAAPRRFNHDATGFSLKRYHDKLTCQACHTRLLFLRKLENDCTSCHKNWGPDTFDHAVTGQPLDETHAEIECEGCHTDGRFVHRPSCEECHDTEEVRYPVKRPGPAAGSR